MMKEQQARMFPENTHGMQESVITSIILTSEFLIFSNDVSIFYGKLKSNSKNVQLTCYFKSTTVGSFGVFLIGILDKCGNLSSYNGDSKYFFGHRRNQNRFCR